MARGPGARSAHVDGRCTAHDPGRGARVGRLAGDHGPGDPPVKAAIIGMGVVGRAQARMFGPHTHVAYDLAQAAYPERAISECDFAVIAVGTPPDDDGRADLRPLFRAMTRLPETMPVLIRSTVPPGTTAD